MSPGHPREALEENIAGRIFSASASLVGICLTAIGLFRISDRLRSLSTFADELLAFDAVAFLVSCILAYLALRTQQEQRRMTIEKIADSLFLSGLCLMALICGLIVYELI